MESASTRAIFLSQQVLKKKDLIEDKIILI